MDILDLTIDWGKELSAAKVPGTTEDAVSRVHYGLYGSLEVAEGLPVRHAPEVAWPKADTFASIRVKEFLRPFVHLAKKWRDDPDAS